MELSFQFSIAMDVAATAYITYLFNLLPKGDKEFVGEMEFFGIDLDSLPASFPRLHFVNKHPSTNPISILI